MAIRIFIFQCMIIKNPMAIIRLRLAHCLFVTIQNIRDRFNQDWEHLYKWAPTVLQPLPVAWILKSCCLINIKHVQEGMFLDKVHMTHFWMLIIGSEAQLISKAED